MPPERPWKDEYTLLCERCGYVIEGIDRSGACPECGNPIEESLPERRTGTPWQVQCGYGSLFRTWLGTIVHPSQTLCNLRLDTKNRGLRVRTAVAAAAIGSAASIITDVLTSTGMAPTRNDRLEYLLALGWGVVAFLSMLAAILVLTKVEEVGIRLIGKRRGLRVSPRIAKSVCDHGAAGWLAGALGALAISVLISPVVDLFLSRRWELVLWTLPILAALPGFLFFEAFAYLGLRRLKFANRERPIALRRPRRPTEPHDDRSKEK